MLGLIIFLMVFIILIFIFRSDNSSEIKDNTNFRPAIPLNYLKEDFEILWDSIFKETSDGMIFFLDDTYYTSYKIIDNREIYVLHYSRYYEEITLSASHMLVDSKIPINLSTLNLTSVVVSRNITNSDVAESIFEKNFKYNPNNLSFTNFLNAYTSTEYGVMNDTFSSYNQIYIPSNTSIETYTYIASME